ncbi:hypothetical protein DY251_09185 [Mesorhizobium denitrificans]|uniref:Uncharacterized protein n=1 Tax=Mesorhizobium denitrificans TaxID=2294114 RepID=A0A371XEV2_9HYPH|nr:hypothetical protein DY251_09185 [Mesorhizobium denitrificans]
MEAGFDTGARSCSKRIMSKAFAIFMIALMAIQIVKPLGLPGLKKRGDFWKLAFVAMAAISITAALGHWS